MTKTTISEQRFLEGSGVKYMQNGNVRCQALSNSQMRRWRMAHNDYDTPNEDLWPECQCPNASTPGLYVCRFHGGLRQRKDIKSIADVMPFDLGEKFKVLLEDPAYISNRENIALLRARQWELLEQQADQVGNPEAWGIVSNALHELRRGNEQTAERMLEDALQSANNEHKAWEEMYRLETLLKDMKSAEVKTAATLKTMATAEEVGRLVARVYEILTSGAQKFIEDKHQQSYFLAYVARELTGAVGLSPVTVSGLIDAGSREDHRDAE
jgi:hypothetical protein